MTRHTALTLALLVLFAGSAHAQSLEELEGVWKRLPAQGGGEARYLHLELNGSGALEGPMVNPPLAEEGIACSVALQLEGAQLTGDATWTEGDFAATARWEFSVSSKDELRGRCEWLSWEGSEVFDRGWDEGMQMVRVPKVGWVTEGEAEAPFGDEIEDLAALTGGWLGPDGEGWAVVVTGEQVSLTRKTGAPLNMVLANERGTLRGVLAVDGVECQVELVFEAGEGHLVGRSSWTAGPVTGWAPVAFTRLERSEVGPEGVSAEAPVASGETPSGVWKRDDGLYLRFRQEAGELVGELLEKPGTVRARLRFAHKAGLWVGTANWGGYETTFELGLDDAGQLIGRAEWVDLHQGQVVARGWSGRTFKALRRVH